MISTGSIGASRRAWNQAFLPFPPHFGLFKLHMKGPLYLMHSDVFLRYLQGTGMYFNCFRNFEIHAGSVENLKKGPELSIFAVFATKGCLRPKWRFTKYLMHSNIFLIYLPGTGFYFNCFCYFVIHTGSARALKGHREEHFCHLCLFLGCLRSPLRSPCI